MLLIFFFFFQKSRNRFSILHRPSRGEEVNRRGFGDSSEEIKGAARKFQEGKVNCCLELLIE